MFDTQTPSVLFELFFSLAGIGLMQEVLAVDDGPRSEFGGPVVSEQLMAFETLNELGGKSDINFIVMCGIEDIYSVSHGVK